MEDPLGRTPIEIVGDVLPGPEAGPEGSGLIDQATQHRYRVFKKNTPFLYDYMCTNSLLWPSLSVQFFPDLEVADQKPDVDPSSAKLTSASQLAHQRLLLGTFTLGQAVDAIHLYQAPYYRDLNKCINTDQWSFNAEKEEFDLPTVSKTKLRLLQSINHHGDVNKLRYMPQNPDVIASANNVGDLCVYNRTKHSTIKKLGEESKVNDPQLRLVNSENTKRSDIFALDWNKQAESVLVAGSMDGQVNVYDIRGSYATKPETSNVIHQKWTKDHGVGINDIEWMHKHDSVFMTADDNGSLSLFDIRSAGPALRTLGYNMPKNSLSVSPHNEFCVASGDTNGEVEIWDIRAMEQSACAIAAHGDSITQVKWHPKFRSVIGSSSADRLVKICDVANTEQPLLFSHEGHMLGVNDFDWSPHEDWMVASVADDNSLHLWRPAHGVIKTVYT